MSIEDEDVIYEAQFIYDQSFDTIDDGYSSYTKVNFSFFAICRIFRS